MLPEGDSSSQGKSSEEESKMEAGQQGPPQAAESKPVERTGGLPGGPWHLQDSLVKFRVR